MGGGLLLRTSVRQESTSFLVERCDFALNFPHPTANRSAILATSPGGGATLVHQGATRGSSLVFRDSTFYGNTAYSGAGVLIYHNDTVQDSSVGFSRCKFLANAALATEAGGGLALTCTASRACLLGTICCVSVAPLVDWCCFQTSTAW